MSKGVPVHRSSPLLFPENNSPTQANTRPRKRSQTDLFCHRNHLSESLCRHMTLWLGHQKLPALNEAAMHVRQQATKVRDLVGRPEGQHEIHGAVYTQGSGFASMCPNTISDPGSFCPLMKNV